MPIYEVTKTSRVYTDEPMEEADIVEAAATSVEGLSYVVTVVSTD